MTHPTNVIHWGRAKPVATKQSAYYDHTFLEVPFSGEFDTVRMRTALIRRFNRVSHGKFGGGSSIGEVTLQSPGLALVETIYHIGD